MADPRERYNDLEESLRLCVDRHLGRVWTSMPVRITEDSKGDTVEAQITIKGWQTDPDSGETTAVDIAPLGKVPIQYAAGGGFTITHPIKKDDEGIVCFQSRNMNGWWDKGGQQEEPVRRRHALSDAIYIPGVRNKPRQLGGNPDEQQQNGQQRADGNGQQKTKPPSTTSVQIRTDSGDYYIELTDHDVNIVCRNCTITAEKEVHIKCETLKIEASESVEIDTKKMTLKASDEITLDTPKVTITGALHVDKELTGTAANLNFQEHVHRYSGGEGDGGPPRHGT